MSEPRTTLYEFMPYGAPELIESGRRHLRIGLTVAMAGALAAFAMLLLAARFLAQPAGGEVVIDLTHHTLDAPPSIIDRVPPLPRFTIAAPPPAARPEAIPLPVPDALAPRIEPQAAPAAAPPSDGGSGEAGGVLQPVAGAGADGALPGPDDWVYTEELPALVTPVVPVYPDLAREAGIEGTVIVRAMIGKDGHVMDVRIARSIVGLDQAAIDAVRRWVFTPALANGKPVVVWVSVPVRFTLH